MKRLIFILFLLACLSGCKKEHVEPVSTADTTINRLPKKVVVRRGDSYIIQRYKYNHKGLITKFWMYDSLTPNLQDSIIYSYHGFSDQLQSRAVYFRNGTPAYDKYTSSQNRVYDNIGRVSVLYDGDSIYVYYYTAAGDVDYITRSNMSHEYFDSIQMHQSSAWTYLRKGEGTLGATNDYKDVKIEAFLNTENGVYEDRPGPVWGAPSTNVPVCINKNIEFQDDVAYTIVPIGQTGYYNMFPRTTAYKYATHAEYIKSLFFYFKQYDAVYTFDHQGRLKTIDAQALGIPDNDTPDPNAIPAVLDFTSTIYY